MSEHFHFFFVKAVGNGSLFVGPKFQVLEDDDEREEIITMAHQALKEVAIDVSNIIKNEDYDDPYFYINNRLNDALEILHELDEDY
ncbi:MAG: hypothetical protein ACFFDW_17735 [Candidatus Thorarchaeota archaeon]